MAMNIFRLIGDLVHVLAIFVLLHRLKVFKNAQGISLKTQELFLFVFLLRYLDLLTTFYSLYNYIMKVFYIASTAFAIWLIKFSRPTKETYRSEQDNISHWKIIFLPSVLLGLIVHMSGSYFDLYSDWIDLMEWAWTASIILESVALVPQILIFRRYRQVENLTGGALILLTGACRMLYILNWIYRAHTEPHYRHHWLVYWCGVVQVIVSFVGFCYTGKLTEDEELPSSPQFCIYF